MVRVVGSKLRVAGELSQGREVRKEGAERRLLGREMLSSDAKRLL